MTTAEKCQEIIAAIVAMCQEERADGRPQISFSADWGGNSLTVEISDLGHTHVGGFHEGATLEELIDNLHGQLIFKRGLSWGRQHE